MKFLFQLPKLKSGLSDKAKDAIYMAFLAERLVEEPRKRVAHVSGRPENVSEHSLMLAKVSVALAQKYYPELDAGKVALYAICHDDIEAYVGDTPSGEWCNTDYEAKESLEARGLEQLIREFENIMPGYVETVKNYELQQDSESRFVRVIDKLVAAIIQITDGGFEVNKNFTVESYSSNELHRYEKIKDDYKDWKKVVDLMPEIADYIVKNLMRSSK